MCHVRVAMCCFGVYMDVRICYVMLYAMVIMCMFYNVADCYMCYLPMRIILYHGVLRTVRNSAPVLAVRNELLVSVGKLHADEAEALHERPPRKTKRSRGEGPLAVHEANYTLCTPARTAHNIFRRRARARAVPELSCPFPSPPTLCPAEKTCSASTGPCNPQKDREWPWRRAPRKRGGERPGPNEAVSQELGTS